MAAADRTHPTAVFSMDYQPGRGWTATAVRPATLEATLHGEPGELRDTLCDRAYRTAAALLGPDVTVTYHDTAAGRAQSRIEDADAPDRITCPACHPHPADAPKTFTLTFTSSELSFLAEALTAHARTVKASEEERTHGHGFASGGKLRAYTRSLELREKIYTESGAWPPRPADPAASTP